MPALNFTVFIDKILSGEKSQTIRRKRKYPIKKGDKLYLYTRMMYKDCRKLGEVVCSKVQPIKFLYEDLFGDGTELWLYIYSANADLENDLPWPHEWKNTLAKDDGFESIKEFNDYFIKSCKMKPGDVVEADIVYWNRLVKVK
jgi:hypothetical protein